MVNAITGPPNNYDFGLDFNYAVWTPSTVLSLVNVPWNNDYRDIVRFANKAALNVYIDELEPSGARIEKLSYVKPNTPIRVKIPINSAIKYNYLRASNPIQPVPGGDVKKDYYYFITDVQYLSPNTTELTVQLDVWQTFGYDVTFGGCYIKKGHIGVANTNNFNNYGRDYLTIPEGMDVGGEYRVVTKRTDDIAGMSIEGMNLTDILVLSSTDLNGDPGTVTDPKLSTGSPSSINGFTSAAEAYIFESGASFSAFMATAKDTPWITQGIISVTAIPKITRYVPDFEYGATGEPKHLNFQSRILKHRYFNNWRDSGEIVNYIPTRYRHLKKFLTYPYMVVEMTTWSATPVILKPESWNNADAFVIERFTMLPPNQRVQFSPRSYNSSGQTIEFRNGLTESQVDAIIAPLPEPMRSETKEHWRDQGDDFGDYLDVMTQISGFPALPVVNNMAISYMASNNASINNARVSADWTQQRALAGAQTGYDQAGRALEAARDIVGTNITADQYQTGNINRTLVAQAVLGAGAGIAGGAAGGALSGGGVGAAAGAGMAAISGGAQLLGAGIQTAANDEAQSIRQSATAANLSTTQRQGTYMRNTNKSLADWAAKGDYANEIRGINAKVQDAQMLQPSISGQFGGDAANIAYGTMELSVRWKMIDLASIRRIGEYWLRYGYEVQQFIVPPSNLMVMNKFTYWHMTETYLNSAPMPETFKQAIRGIFEKGVTVWARPEYIGNTDYADNTPLGGISF